MAAMQQASREGGGEVSEHFQEGLKALSLVILLVIALMVAQQRDELKAEAVKRGFATWVSDENGNTTFTWKEPIP